MAKKTKVRIDQLTKPTPVDCVTFRPVEIDISNEKDCGDESCMFCKKTLCECDNIATYGYVKTEVNEYKKVGDMALARRDSFSKWEKEAKDKEYADSSRLASHKLDMEKRGASQYQLPDTVRKEVLSDPNKRLKYIMTGET